MERKGIAIFSRIEHLESKIKEYITDDAASKVSITSVPVPDIGNKILPEILTELQKAHIIITDPHVITEQNLHHNFPQLEWMMCTWAGVDRLLKGMDKGKPAPSYKLTRFGGVFGTHMSEYLLGYIIAHERCLKGIDQAQREKSWPLPLDHRFRRYRLLSELTVGILGVGDIGKTVAKACKNVDMKVHGWVRRQVPASQQCPYVDVYRTEDQFLALLNECDYLVNILPSTSETRGLLAGSVLSNCSKKPVLINLGRGDVIPEADVIQALDKGWISHAILDVFEKEPLPQDSPLWTHPKVTVTPHVSCNSFPWQVAELFCQNLISFLDGKPLKYTVNWNEGY